jgi:hypothetical protein
MAVAGMLAAGGLFTLAPAASASTLLVSCPTGNVTGSGTVSPPITKTNTQKNTLMSSGSFSGCTGQETSGTFSSTQTTVAPVTCASLKAPPPPAGTVLSTGTFTITWGDNTQSTGTVKSKSSGMVGVPGPVIEKITSGQFFLAGHTTKSKTTLTLTPGQTSCGTTGISSFTFTNASPANTTQT